MISDIAPSQQPEHKRTLAYKCSGRITPVMAPSALELSTSSSTSLQPSPSPTSSSSYVLCELCTHLVSHRLHLLPSSGGGAAAAAAAASAAVPDGGTDGFFSTWPDLE